MFAPRSTEPSTVAYFGKQVEYRRLKEIEEEIERRENPLQHVSSESRQIIEIMGQTIEQHNKYSHDTSRDGLVALNLLFGQSMQTYARDKEAESKRRR